MGNIVELHKAVKERPVPQVSALAMAEYLIGTADFQESVLQNSRWVHPSVVIPYSTATRALRAYNTDPHRNRETLRRVKGELTIKAAQLVEPTEKRAKAEALRCIEAIEQFELTENALGLRGMPTVSAPRFPKLDINGVAISVQPDFLVKPQTPGVARVGGGMFRLSKSPDIENCKRDATRQDREWHRREVCFYLNALMQILLEQHSEHGAVDRDLIFVADVRLRERIGPAADHTARISAIRGACDQIHRLWGTLEPKASIRRKIEGGS